jgi:hypothetical protein
MLAAKCVFRFYQRADKFYQDRQYGEWQVTNLLEMQTDKTKKVLDDFDASLIARQMKMIVSQSIVVTNQTLKCGLILRKVMTSSRKNFSKSMETTLQRKLMTKALTMMAKQWGERTKFNPGYADVQSHIS